MPQGLELSCLLLTFTLPVPLAALTHTEHIPQLSRRSEGNAVKSIPLDPPLAIAFEPIPIDHHFRYHCAEHREHVATTAVASAQLLPGIERPHDSESKISSLSSGRLLSSKVNGSHKLNGSHSSSSPTNRPASATPSAAKSHGKQPVAAVLIDPAWDDGIEATLKHFLLLLPKDVPIYWYSDWRRGPFSALNISDYYIASSLATGRFKTCIIHTHNGSATTLDKDVSNQLRLEPSFWRAMPATHVLLFQRDSVLCSGARPLSHYVAADYDFVGAPWDPRFFWCANLPSPTSCCCNSGLSLVNAPRMAAALVQMESTPQPPADGIWVNNDMYLFFKTRNASVNVKLRRPSQHEAQTFAVETFWNADSAPFGLHKPWHGNFLAEKSSVYTGGREVSKLDRLGQLCPEVRLLCGAAQESAKDQDLVNSLPAQQFLKHFCASDVHSKSRLWHNSSGV